MEENKNTKKKEKKGRKSLKEKIGEIKAEYEREFSDEHSKRLEIITNLAYNRGYSYEARLSKIDGYLSSHAAPFSEPERVYVYKILSTTKNHLKENSKKSKIKDYNIVENKLEDILKDFEPQEKKELTFTPPISNKNNSYFPIEVEGTLQQYSRGLMNLEDITNIITNPGKERIDPLLNENLPFWIYKPPVSPTREFLRSHYKKALAGITSLAAAVALLFSPFEGYSKTAENIHSEEDEVFYGSTNNGRNVVSHVNYPYN